MSEESKKIRDALCEKIIITTERLAMENGAKNVTVRKVLKELNVSNRVFYNRFYNIDEVLQIIYKRTVMKMRISLVSSYNAETDFCAYVKDICSKVLIMTYDLKKQFSQYMFEFDSATEENRRWWMDKIKEIIEVGKETNQINDVNPEMLSYTVWCFIRGYCADAIKRGLLKEEAKAGLDFGLGCLLQGIIK